MVVCLLILVMLGAIQRKALIWHTDSGAKRLLAGITI